MDITGDAPARPGVIWHVLEQGNSRAADVDELFYVIPPRTPIRISVCQGYILIEAGQRRIESARKPESTKRKQALTIGYVIQDPANTPFRVDVPVLRLRL
jgi:hypothetical protein